MPAINVMRTWTDEVVLAVQRIDESRTALTELAGDASKLDDTLHALASGSTWDDPFEAARDLAEAGNRGMWDAWTKGEAAHSILKRAIAKHPAGDGATQLLRAQALTEQASGDLGNFIVNGGHRNFAGLERAVSAQLDQAREAAQLALAAG